MTKAERIRALYAKGRTTREIAVEVFRTRHPTAANLAYVRVSGRQRLDGSKSAADKRYYYENGGREMQSAWAAHRYATDAKFRENALAYQANRYATDAKFRARTKARARAWQLANPERVAESRRAYRRKKALGSVANHI